MKVPPLRSAPLGLPPTFTPHSLRYFHIAVSEPSPGVPEFVAVGYVDGTLISRYDSETRRVVPRADWMAANLDQQYWERNTQIAQNNQQINRVNLETLRGRYNQSGSECGLGWALVLVPVPPRAHTGLGWGVLLLGGSVPH
uniref:MHC class I-like antigen recognition-like domain-containing protein n=1 Tax=Calidris pygmaea TaxID=425635 RepID=A0A8C3JA09_9CHAR